MTEITVEDQLRREAMTNFIRRVGWSFTLKNRATERWGREVTVIIAEKGTFRGLPVKGWTNTETGTIFMREEIFDGIDLTDPRYQAAVNVTIEALTNGTPINRLMICRRVENFVYLRTKEHEDTVWKIAQTVAAAYGVYGHEFGHAAYSEHAMRDSYQMGLEDLREESLWMAEDPIRARQGLRACAANWVLHDSSPMAGTQELDLSKVKSHANLLHLYLLIVGRGRIGVLDDRSVLVTGIRDLAEKVLGWELLSDANDIIDRFIETAEDPSDPIGAAERAALAKEFLELLPKDAGKPDPTFGCFPQPVPQQAEDSDDESEPGEGESEPGDGDSDESEPGEGEGEDESGGGEPGEGESEGQSDESDGEGEGDGSGQSGDEDSEESEDTGGSTTGTGDSDPTAGNDATESGRGDDGDEGDEDGEDESDGPTVGTNRGGDEDGDGEDGEGGQDKDADFLTGAFGEQVHPGEEDVTDELDESSAYHLTEEEVRTLAEVLTDGLEEIATDEGGAGWAISDEDGILLQSRTTSPAKVGSEVFSRKALVARNRRLKAAT